MLNTNSMSNLWRLKSISKCNLIHIANLKKCLNVRFFFSGERKKEYHGRKLVGYSMEQMYTVVADVKNYKKFVPFCKKSLIVDEEPGYLKAELEVGFPPIIEGYTSHVTLVEPYLVTAKCVDGTLFNFLETNWKFSPGLRSNPNSCIIDFYVNFEFKSIFHSQVALMFFEKLVDQMEWAFISEAKRRYGHESLPSHKLTTPKRKS